MKTCTAQELKEALEKGGENVRFIDVRSPEEYAQERIEGFTNVQLSVELVKDWNKEDVIYAHCLEGGRSKFACMQLENIGFKNTFNVEGGIQAWKEAGYGVV